MIRRHGTAEPVQITFDKVEAKLIPIAVHADVWDVIV